MNTQDLAHAVSLTLGDHLEDFDVPAIVADLVKEFPAVVDHGVHAVCEEVYWDVVARHDAVFVPGFPVLG